MTAAAAFRTCSSEEKEKNTELFLYSPKTGQEEGYDERLAETSSRLLADTINKSLDARLVDYLAHSDGSEQEKKQKPLQFFLRSADIFSELAILSPIKEGPLGTRQLGTIARISVENWLKKMTETSADELKSASSQAVSKMSKRFACRMNDGNAAIFEGMRVMCVKNDYENSIFNGDCGVVCDLSAKKKTARVFFPSSGVRCAYYLNESDAGTDKKVQPVSLLSSAYAYTIHKAQGAEYKMVFLAIPPSKKKFINRSMLYTAITRASEQLIICGDQEVFAAAITQKKEIEPTSPLEEKIINTFNR